MRAINIIIDTDPNGEPIYLAANGLARNVIEALEIISIGGWEDFNYIVEILEGEENMNWRELRKRPLQKDSYELNPKPGEQKVYILGYFYQLN